MNNKDIAKRVYELSKKSRKIEKEISELKEVLKEKGSAKYGDYVVVVQDCCRENFKLQEAKKSLSESVWAKVKAFVSVSDYQKVLVEKL